jgi:hypothetical protein
MDTWEDYRALHEDVFGGKPKEIADLMRQKCLTNGKPKRLI